MCKGERMLAANYAIPHMARRGGGVIINVGSAGGHTSESVRPMYGTTQAAIIGLTKNIATHHAKDRIRCVSISLGPIISPSAAEVVPDRHPRRRRAPRAFPELGRPNPLK
jgi:NAD(P)-dependent dehydrogenase (short-subunit alcohol dehydrogenase family)